MISEPSSHALYGAPPPDLVERPEGARQLSPLVPGADAIEALADESLDSVAMLAPPGAAERRYALAQALRALRPGGGLTALAPKDRGGTRLRAELEGFGCTVEERSKAHHRIVVTTRPDIVRGLDDAIAENGPRFDEKLGLWTQPGIFSVDRIDPGTSLLLRHLPALAGTGADLGSGLGLLAKAALISVRVERLHLVELDRRAVEASRRNVEDPRGVFHWGDARASSLSGLDFVLSNPPFHAEGTESRQLGQDFVRAASAILKRGGRLHLVANRHLPYETVLRERFARVETVAEEGGFKLFEAVK